MSLDHTYHNGRVAWSDNIAVDVTILLTGITKMYLISHTDPVRSFCLPVIAVCLPCSFGFALSLLTLLSEVDGGGDVEDLFRECVKEIGSQEVQSGGEQLDRLSFVLWVV
jgi:hypothetical protein